jgi:hypothetical protein
VATSLIFLILFNNILYGRIVLASLILMNVGFMLILPFLIRPPEHRKPAVLTSIYTMSLIGAWLLTEIMFPLLLPKDCGQVLNISKTSLPSADDAGFSDLIYDNKQENPVGTAKPVPKKDKPLSWHRNGGKYVYHGYDPNTDRKYMNIVHWNSHGYYDLERNTNKPPGTYRIVLIGDSFVESIQVPLAGTFHKLLEKELNDHSLLGPDRKVEVIALGTSGAGQVKNHTVLVNEGLGFKPDLVGMTLYSNDFCDDDPILSDEMAFAAGVPGTTFRRFARHGYYALAFVFHRLDGYRREKQLCNPELLQWCGEDIPRVESAWKRTLERVQASRDVCKKHGIKFVLIYIGSELELKHALDPAATAARLKDLTGPQCCASWDMEKSLRRVSSYCANQKIPFISLLDPLIRSQRTSAKAMFGDHYTMLGHQVAAKTLFCSLRLVISPSLASQPLPDCCKPETLDIVYDRTAVSRP